MDGTVFESHLDWKKIKVKLGIKNGNILKEIYKNGVPDAYRLHILEDFEKHNTLKTKPIKGISDFLLFLKSRNIKTALVTNNNKKNTEFLLNKFNFKFDQVVTREMKLWKPDPDAFNYVINKFGLDIKGIISIGDSHYDIIASKKAYIESIFILFDGNDTERGAQLKAAAKSIRGYVTFFKSYLELKTYINDRLN